MPHNTAPEAGGSRRGAGLVLTVMCLGLMLSMFNSTMVNVILPDISARLDASATQMQWISAIYSLCYAAFLLPGGALGNRIGRRASFLVGVLGFVVGSAGCALAPGIGVLLAARVVQALGAATMLPQTMAIIVHEYRNPSARAKAVGVWAGVSSLGLAAGPVLGGIILTFTSWRGGFILSVLLGLATCTLAYVVIPASRHGRNADALRIDLWGAALSVVALVALVFGLIESSSLGWTNPQILASFALAAIAVAAFLVLESGIARRGGAPVMPLRIWRSLPFIGANLAGLAYFFMFFGILYFFSVGLQQEEGYSALATGLAFLPMLVIQALLGQPAGRLADHFGAARVLTVGILVGMVGCALLSFLPAAPGIIDIEWRFAIVGVGAGLMSAPMSNLAVSSVDLADASNASAVHSMCRQIGATLGVAVLGSVVASADTFARGLDMAMALTAALLFVVGIAVVLLGRRSHTVGPC